MKRAFDLALVLPALLILLPVMALVAMLVRFSIGTPVLFRQLRPGLDGKPFELIKFRTMTNERSPDGASLPDARRLGRVGRLLRASSLDELPELFNVLRGEMSLVGPRPLLMEYLPLYDRDQARRHDVLPGLTGWAQITGRNALIWEEKFAADVWYVDNHNLWLDCRIIGRTVLAVLNRNGISAAGNATMPPFTGSVK